MRTYSAIGPEASKAVEKLLIETAPLMLAKILGAAAQSVLDQFKYSIQSNRGY